MKYEAYLVVWTILRTLSLMREESRELVRVDYAN
jgi:hypothetical protein